MIRSVPRRSRSRGLSAWLIPSSGLLAYIGLVAIMITIPFGLDLPLPWWAAQPIPPIVYGLLVAASVGRLSTARWLGATLLLWAIHVVLAASTQALVGGSGIFPPPPLPALFWVPLLLMPLRDVFAHSRKNHRRAAAAQTRRPAPASPPPSPIVDETPVAEVGARSPEQADASARPVVPPAEPPRGQASATQPAPAEPSPTQRLLDEMLSRETSGEAIRISFDRIAGQLPPAAFSGPLDRVSAGLVEPGYLLIPQRLALVQLAEGLVRAGWEVVAEQFPRSLMAVPDDEIRRQLPDGQLVLPLDEIVRQMPSELFRASGPALEMRDIENFPAPFKQFVSGDVPPVSTEVDATGIRPVEKPTAAPPPAPAAPSVAATPPAPAPTSVSAAPPIPSAPRAAVPPPVPATVSAVPPASPVVAPPSGRAAPSAPAVTVSAPPATPAERRVTTVSTVPDAPVATSIPAPAAVAPMTAASVVTATPTTPVAASTPAAPSRTATPAAPSGTPVTGTPESPRIAPGPSLAATSPELARLFAEASVAAPEPDIGRTEQAPELFDDVMPASDPFEIERWPAAPASTTDDAREVEVVYLDDDIVDHPTPDRGIVSPTLEPTPTEPRPSPFVMAEVSPPAPQAPAPAPSVRPEELAAARSIAAHLAPLVPLDVDAQLLDGVTLFTVSSPVLDREQCARIAATMLPVLEDLRAPWLPDQLTLRGATASLVLTPLGSPATGGPILAAALPAGGSLALLEIRCRTAAADYGAHGRGRRHDDGALDEVHDEPDLLDVDPPTRLRQMASTLGAVGPVTVSALRDAETERPLYLFLPAGTDVRAVGGFAADVSRLVREAAAAGVLFHSAVFRSGRRRLVIRIPEADTAGSSIVVAAGETDRPGLAYRQVESAAMALAAL